MTGKKLSTVCIVSFRVDQPSETFVRRHVSELNGGNTVVVARQPTEDGAAGKSFLHWPKPIRMQQHGGLFARWFSRPHYDLGNFPQAFEAFARAHGVGAVLCEFGPVGINFHDVARRAGLPVFCYFRGYDASKKLRSRRYRQDLAAMLPKIDGVFAVSRYLLDRLDRRGLNHPNSHVIPSGVDTALLAPTDKDPNLILSVGRMVEKKAPLTTIRAFARVAARHPTLRLEMVGDGWLLNRARKLASRLRVEDRVTFHGRQDHAFVLERMKRAAIYMQHSVTSLSGDTEGVPTAIQEAMAAGAAIVSTRHAGIPEIVDEGLSGLLVGERDVSGYAAALERLVVDPELRARMGSAARTFAIEHLDYRKLYARLETAMAETIAARNR